MMNTLMSYTNIFCTISFKRVPSTSCLCSFMMALREKSRDKTFHVGKRKKSHSLKNVVRKCLKWNEI